MAVTPTKRLSEYFRQIAEDELRRIRDSHVREIPIASVPVQEPVTEKVPCMEPVESCSDVKFTGWDWFLIGVIVGTVTLFVAGNYLFKDRPHATKAAEPAKRVR